MKRILLSLITVIMLCSCSPLYNVSTSNKTSGIFDKGTKVLVLTSKDGASGSDVSNGSGFTVSNKIQSMLISKQCLVKTDREKDSILDLNEETATKYDYIIVPVINLWEDNATAWSGKPDKLNLTILIYDGKKELITSGELQGQSAAAVIDENDPSELIDPLLQDYFKNLFK